MKLLTVFEVSEMLGTAYSTVRELILSGQLKAVNVSSKTRKVWRIDEEELKAFIKKGGCR